MKRLLVVAEDRELTRFVAEALLGRGLNAPPHTHAGWDVARAHSGLEGLALIEHGGRPFDCVLFDQALPDQELIETISQVRSLSEAKELPIFVLSERGKDQHSRRLAAERYGVAGFLDKPVTMDTLRHAFDTLESKRKILLVESKQDVADRYMGCLKRHGYSIEHVTTGRAAVDRFPRLKPDAVVSALLLEDVNGTEVCVEIKKLDMPSPVVLYGQLAALKNVDIDVNAYRADDFVQAPFDDEILVERVGMLVGRGATKRLRRRKRSVAPSSVSSTQPGDRLTQEGPPPEDPTEAMRAPPPSASPAPAGPTRRSTRRVPCNISMSVENDGRTYTSKTLDISHGGIFLATEEELEIGTRLSMTFQFPSSEHEISAMGKVAWVGSGGADGSRTGVGVKFSRIDPKDLKLIVDYVNNVSRVVYSAT